MMMRLSSISSSYQDDFVTVPTHPDNIFSHDGDADDNDYILMVMMKIYENDDDQCVDEDDFVTVPTHSALDKIFHDR